MNIWLSFYQDIVEELLIAFFAFQKRILNLEVRLQNWGGLIRNKKRDGIVRLVMKVKITTVIMMMMTFSKHILAK